MCAFKSCHIMYTNEMRTKHGLTCYASINEIQYRDIAGGSRSLCNNNNLTTVLIPSPVNTTNINSSPQNDSTPPLKRFQKVNNPFDSALTERLHLPLTVSPSLFKCCSQKRQLSSTQFEWDIVEVSELKPADVVPNETQFHDSPDSELESKAQMAISAFFKESLVVPSPVDCPLRKQRIILNTPISRKSKPLGKDCEVQTELLLPPVLPQALEDALRPYLQPHLAGKGVDPLNNSMRRKLFDLKNVIVLGEMEQIVGSSPQSKRTIFAGRLSDSSGEDSCSFGCLSPIRNTCGTPDSCKRTQLLQDDMIELPSPIAKSEHLSRRFQRSSSNKNSDSKASPMALECSMDSSINLYSRLRVSNKKIEYETDQAIMEQEAEMDSNGMHISMHSLSCSSSNSDTPRGHRRRNLSQSFSVEMLDATEMQTAHAAEICKEPFRAAPSIGFYGTDSGFNETTNISNFASNDDSSLMNVSMVSCSTPSKGF